MVLKDRFLKDYNWAENSNCKKGHFFQEYIEDITNAIIPKYEKITLHKYFNICDDMPSQSDEIVKYAKVNEY